MYKMLIVDDNPADRRGIASILNWEELGIEIAGTCTNGEKALDIISRQKVDIVLTDIAMPIINGIELAEQIKTSYPQIKIVFMSCYSDFDYARSAMDLDIYGYILKPVIPSELLKAIQKLLAEYGDELRKRAEKEAMAKQMKDMLPLVQEQYLKELLLGNCFELNDIFTRMEYLELDVGPSEDFYVISLAIDEYEKKTQNLTVEEKYYISYTIKNILTSYNNSEISIFPVQFSSRDYSGIICIKLTDSSPDIVDLAVTIHTGILSQLEISTTLGISKMAKDITKVHELYRQSMDAVNTQFYGGSNPIILYEVAESGRYATLDQTVNLEELYLEIKALVTLGDENAVTEFIDRYYRIDHAVLPESYIKSLTFSIVNMLAVTMTELGYSFGDVFGSEVAIWEKMGRFKTIVNLRQWLMNLFKALREYLADRGSSRDQKVVDGVKQFIREHYHEQITIEDIAKAIFLSQSYANSIMRKETGKSIFEYLLEYRLEMAKKLLLNADSKVAVVAESVGYENKSHFSLMFKKYVGISPSDYKARFTS